MSVWNYEVVVGHLKVRTEIKHTQLTKLYWR